MQITNPVLGLYHNSEFIRYMKDVVSICNSNNPRELKIDPQVNSLEAAIDPLDNLFMIERGNLLTAELLALDARRDAAISGIRLAATAFTYHFEDATKKAALVLAAGIDKYGSGIARLNYIAETEVIVALVADFSNNAALKQAAETLGIQNWITEMETANTLFNKNYLARTADYASKPAGSLTELRAGTATVYSVLIAHISSHATLTPSDNYNKLINALNSLTDQYNRLANGRTTVKEVTEELQPDVPTATGAEA